MENGDESGPRPVSPASFFAFFSARRTDSGRLPASFVALVVFPIAQRYIATPAKNEPITDETEGEVGRGGGGESGP